MGSWHIPCYTLLCMPQNNIFIYTNIRIQALGVKYSCAANLKELGKKNTLVSGNAVM